MSEENEHQDDEQDQTPEGIKNLREANKRLTEQVKAGEAATRTLAFRDAGIDTTKGVGVMFAEHYKGELTVEAIKADAPNWGISIAESTPPAADPDAARRAAEEDHQRRLHNDGGAENDPEMHEGEPIVRILNTYDEMVAGGLSREKARAHAMSEVLGDAMNGGETFRWDAAKHAASAVPETEARS